MKKCLGMILPALLLQGIIASGQPIDSVKFFTDEGVIEMTLTTDIRKLQQEKRLDVFQEATINCRFPDSTVINETISVGPRGHYRRIYCNIPPLMLNFRNAAAPRLSSLGKLKLVIGCGYANDDEQLVLKEYLAYKVYNLLEEKSFRTRLVKVNYRDTRNKIKPFSQYAFILEDDKDLAARCGCIKKDTKQVLTESTDRELMTKVAMFQYMISNGDWSVPGDHNVKLIYDKNTETSLPYCVPYDFDHSGFVNAGYALPSEVLGTETVKERVYRGFPRTMEELQRTIDVFNKQKENIYSLIRNFSLLKPRNRTELIDYLEEFYKTINNKSEVRNIFIDNARTN